MILLKNHSRQGIFLIDKKINEEEEIRLNFQRAYFNTYLEHEFRMRSSKYIRTSINYSFIDAKN
jgi:hypothetical protein